MANPIQISTREEADLIRAKGYEPLMLFEIFLLPTLLREELIRDIFPRYSVANNQKFYRWYWDNIPGDRTCEECGTPLRNYWSGHVSHILPRGGYPQHAYDPRNINLLCHGHHTIWGGHAAGKEALRIYPGNQLRIEALREYENELKDLTTFDRNKQR